MDSLIALIVYVLIIVLGHSDVNRNLQNNISMPCGMYWFLFCLIEYVIFSTSNK